MYPLGRWVTAGGVETFRTMRPHPQSAGICGQEDTVAGFLERQGVAPYLAAADRLQALFYRLFDALQGVLARMGPRPETPPRACKAKPHRPNGPAAPT